MTLPGVIFDMDGLLLDTERLCLDAFVQARRAFSLPDSPDIYLSCVGMHAMACTEIMTKSLNDTARLDDFNREWDRRIDEAIEEGVPVKTGAIELLQILTENGHPLAVATSTRTTTALKRLEGCGLHSYFKSVVGGDQVSKHKPDPEPYQAAAASLGFHAQDCIAFEDTDTGVRSAVASGAMTVQVPDLVPPSEAVRALGHLIAPNLIAGATAAGLLKEKA
ncbi:MAG: HAD family phosphatase [Pseudomonadota bacterium]